MKSSAYFIDPANVYSSILSSFNFYCDSGESFTTFSNQHASYIEHMRTGEKCYFIVQDHMPTDAESIKMWRDFLARPAMKNFFWPVDIIDLDSPDGDSYAFVYPCRSVVRPMPLYDMMMREEIQLGFENYGVQPLAANLINSFVSLYRGNYLYLIWSDRNIFVNLRDYTVLLPFSEFITQDKRFVPKDRHCCEYTDPYAFSHDKVYDRRSEMFAMVSLMFRLLIGRCPYEGAEMDAFVKDTNFEVWISEYLSRPYFMFDKFDTRNMIGHLGAMEKICIKRWNSLTPRLREMFRKSLAQENVMRLNPEPVMYSPVEWRSALEEFDWTMKNVDDEEAK